MIGNINEAWSYCSSRPHSDILQVWFSCSPFVLRVCHKDRCYARGLQKGWATLMLNVAAISIVLNPHFPNIIAWACSMYFLFVDMDGCPYLCPSTTLVWLLLIIFIHPYILHCCKEFCPHVAADCQWISAIFIPSGTKKALLDVACPSCENLVQQ